MQDVSAAKAAFPLSGHKDRADNSQQRCRAINCQAVWWQQDTETQRGQNSHWGCHWDMWLLDSGECRRRGGVEGSGREGSSAESGGRWGVQDREAGERSEPGGRVVWGFGLIFPGYVSIPALKWEGFLCIIAP